MRPARVTFVFASTLAALLTVTGSANAQQPRETPDPRTGWHIAPESGAVRDMRHRLTLVATRAIGYFMSADSIEASLRSQGLSLHPEIAVLRVRLEGALDQTEAAINRGDLDAAGKSMDMAQALLDRFAAKLGG